MLAQSGSTLPPPDVDAAGEVRRIGFLVIDGFSMVALSCAIEVLRAANQVVGCSEYEWTIITSAAESVSAADGVTQVGGVSYREAGVLDLVLVCGGESIAPLCDARLASLLHRMADGGVLLGGLGSGAYALVKAGLLDGYRCTVQWDDLHRLREEHASVSFLDRFAVIDRNRFTSSGGIAPIDLMLALIDYRFGPKVGVQVARRLRKRSLFANEEWEVGLAQDDRAESDALEHWALRRVVYLMRANVEEPLSVHELAVRTGMSLRHLQRMFQVAFEMSLTSYYLDVRLQYARRLVTETPTALTEIAIASGFKSQSHFSRAYKFRFGKSPRKERCLTRRRF